MTSVGGKGSERGLLSDRSDFGRIGSHFIAPRPVIGKADKSGDLPFVFCRNDLLFVPERVVIGDRLIGLRRVARAALRGPPLSPVADVERKMSN